MPRKSTVTGLPPEVKSWLDKSLIETSFSGYEALAAALAEKGFTISKSSLHRYGKGYEAVIEKLKESTEIAKSISDACPDDAGAMNDAMIRIVQEKIFQVLMSLEADPEKVKLPVISKMIGDLGRASVTVKKFASEVRAKAQTAAQEVAKVAAKGGLSSDTIKQIEEQILGIAR